MYSRLWSLDPIGAVKVRLLWFSDDIRLAIVAWHSRNEDIFRSEKYFGSAQRRLISLAYIGP